MIDVSSLTDFQAKIALLIERHGSRERADCSFIGKICVANARLISRAPELLEALEELTGTTCDECTSEDCHTIHCRVYYFNQLITRAKGGNE